MQAITGAEAAAPAVGAEPKYDKDGKRVERVEFFNIAEGDDETYMEPDLCFFRLQPTTSTSVQRTPCYVGKQAMILAPRVL